MMHPPKEEDGEEGWLKWFGKQMALSAFGGVPIFRDIVGHYAGGKDYEMSPTRRSCTTPTAWCRPEGRQHARALDQARHDRGRLHPGDAPGPARLHGAVPADVWDGKQHPEDIAEWWRGVTTGDMQKH
jgi:hypothetical protein